jgi:DNA-binding Lrp family transcriptional regulator
MSEWTFITNHGLALACIARDQQITTREIAQALKLTERTIHNIVADLEAEGYIEIQRIGRNNFYRIHPHLGLRHETIMDIEVGDLLRILGWKRRRKFASG